MFVAQQFHNSDIQIFAESVSNGSSCDTNGNEFKTQFEIENDSIVVDFGDEISLFSKQELRQLSYFESKLSNRWQQYNREYYNEIDDIDDNDYHYFDSSIEIFGQSLKPVFGSKDLRLLLKCTELGHIPKDLKPDCKVIENLIACSDYLTSNKDALRFSVNRGTLMEYFQTCVPSLTANQRKELLLNSKHDLLKSILFEWDQKLSHMVNHQRQIIVENCCHLQLNSINLDPLTTKSIFESKFRININLSNDGRFIIAKIPDFSNMSNYDKLLRISQRYYDANFCVISMAKDIVQKLNNLSNIKSIIFESSAQATTVDNVLNVVWRDLVGEEFERPVVVKKPKHLHNQNHPDYDHISALDDNNSSGINGKKYDRLDSKSSFRHIQIDHGLLLITMMRVAFERGNPWINVYEYIAPRVDKLSQEDQVRFTRFLLDNHDRYSKRFKYDSVERKGNGYNNNNHNNNNNNDDSDNGWDSDEYDAYHERRRKAFDYGLTQWMKLVEYCVKKIIISGNVKFVVNTAEMWFPILHEIRWIDSKSIVNLLLPKLGSQLTFEFALYLSKYAVIERKDNIGFPAQYVRLIKKYVGIDWSPDKPPGKRVR